MGQTQISIVILIKNGGLLFKQVIKMIFSQNVTLPYEVIIVDSGSIDGTEEFLKNYPVRLFKIEPQDFSFGPTRDFGFSKAKGEYIVTLSQDAVPGDEYWLQNLIEPLLKNEADIVQASIIIPTNKKIFFWEKEDMFYFVCKGRNNFHRKYGDIALSCINLAIKKSIWQEIKFGNTPMCEDKMLQKNAFAKGFRLLKNRKAILYHGHNYNLHSLIKRCENEGLGWKYVGVNYSFREMIKDLKQPKWIYGKLLRGILNRNITNIAEVLFFLIKPIFFYKGNKFNRSYVV